MTLGEKTVKALRPILDNLVEKGFKTPIHVSAITIGGRFINLTFSWSPEKGDYNTKYVYFPEDVEKETCLTFPMNLMFVDKDGRSAHVTMKTESAKDIIYH